MKKTFDPINEGSIMPNYLKLIHLAELLHETKELMTELEASEVPDFLQLELKDALDAGLAYAIGDTLVCGRACPAARFCRDSVLCSVEGDLDNRERKLVEPILNRLKNA